MAKMYRTDQLNYPSFGALVRDYLPTLAEQRPRTFAAYVQHSGLSAADARESLRWGRGPQLRFGTTYRPASIIGLTVHSTGGGTAIWIRPDFAREVEEDWSRWEARLRAEALVLHEMTHVGEHETGLGGTRERGEDFERAAYRGLQPVRLSYRVDSVSYPPSLREQAPPASVGTES